MVYTIHNFDWKFYLDQHHDIKEAGITTKEKAWNHWTKYGKNENRLSRKIKTNYNLEDINNNLKNNNTNSRFIKIYSLKGKKIIRKLL